MTLGLTPGVLSAELLIPIFHDIPFIQFLYVVFLGSWGSAAALLQKLVPAPPVNWRLVVLRDMINSVLASVLMFMICRNFDVSPPLEAVSCALAGYGGARFMETLYARFVTQVGGGTEKDKTDNSASKPSYSDQVDSYGPYKPDSESSDDSPRRLPKSPRKRLPGPD